MKHHNHVFNSGDLNGRTWPKTTASKIQCKGHGVQVRRTEQPSEWIFNLRQNLFFRPDIEYEHNAYKCQITSYLEQIHLSY